MIFFVIFQFVFQVELLLLSFRNNNNFNHIIKFFFLNLIFNITDLKNICKSIFYVMHDMLVTSTKKIKITK
jgi:hypothetical protein